MIFHGFDKIGVTQKHRLYLMSIKGNVFIGFLEKNNHTVIYSIDEIKELKESILQFSKHEDLSVPRFYSFSKLIKDNSLNKKVNCFLIKSCYGDLLYIRGIIPKNIDSKLLTKESIKYLVLDHVTGQLEALMLNTFNLKGVIINGNLDKTMDDIVQDYIDKNVKYSILRYTDYINLETTSCLR